MQIIVNFQQSIEEYLELGENNFFPEFFSCPMCKSQKKLEKHGFYSRNVVLLKDFYKIFILRYYCPCCGKTVSLLPSFLLPYFQYPLFILQELKAYFYKIKSEFKAYLQLRQFFVRRFLRNLNRIKAYFRDSGFLGALPPPENEKAIKLIEKVMQSSFLPTHLLSVFYFSVVLEWFLLCVLGKNLPQAWF